MNNIIMTWPDFKFKALTLSYDDGVTTDRRFIKLIDKYGIKATFHLNSMLYGKGGETFPKGQFGRLSRDEATALYKDSGHEIAAHTLHHKLMTELTSEEAYREIFEDKRNLEMQFGCIIRGMAFPMGGISDELEKIAKECGMVYAKISNSSLDYQIPQNWLRLKTTCNHSHPRFKELYEAFIEKTSNSAELFFLRGHSYEFEQSDNWELIEEFCEKIGNRDDIWYATNIEVFDYITAYRNLQYSANMDMIHNPSAIPVYVTVNGNNTVIGGGETVKIS
jgi:hypothetical protein